MPTGLTNKPPMEYDYPPGVFYRANAQNPDVNYNPLHAAANVGGEIHSADDERCMEDRFEDVASCGTDSPGSVCGDEGVQGGDKGGSNDSLFQRLGAYIFEFPGGGDGVSYRYIEPDVGGEPTKCVPSPCGELEQLPSLRHKPWTGYDSWGDWYTGNDPADRRVTAEDVVSAESLLEHLDTGGDETVPTEAAPAAKRCRGKTDRKSRIKGQASRGFGLAARMAREAKGEFYELDHTKANKMVVARFIRNRLRELGTRADLICDVVCVAEKMFWIPTQREEQVSRAAATDVYHNAFRNREDAYRDGYRWGVTRWLESVGLLSRTRAYGPRPSA